MAQRTWLITGASRGIGAEIAKAVLAAGDRLIATARNQADLQQFSTNKDALVLSMDVTDEAQVKAAIATSLEKFGQIDVLVNNAGFGLLGAVEECSAEEVESVYRTNVFGLLNVTRACYPVCVSTALDTSLISRRSVAIAPPQDGASMAQPSLPSKALPKPCMGS